MAGAVPLTVAALAGRAPAPAGMPAAAAGDDLVTAGTLLLGRLASHSLLVQELVLRWANARTQRAAAAGLAEV
jgi:hypothetical protein